MPPYFYMTSCTPRQYSILVRIHHYLVAGREWYVCNLSCTQSCNMHLKKCNFATLINKPKCHRPTITSKLWSTSWIGGMNQKIIIGTTMTPNLGKSSFLVYSLLRLPTGSKLRLMEKSIQVLTTIQPIAVRPPSSTGKKHCHLSCQTECSHGTLQIVLVFQPNWQT